MLTASMSKSDLSSLKQRLGAQWKMNRLRLVHGLRYSFHHMCVTEGLGSATLCPIDMYDRVQTDAECILTMSKKEVMQLFGRPGRMFSWTQLVRHLLVYPDYVALPKPVVPDFPARPSEMLRSLRSSYAGPGFSPGLGSSQSVPTLPSLRR